MIKNVYWSSCKVPHYSYQIKMKTEFSGQIFEKSSNSMKNLSSGSRVVPCGQTDMTKLIIALCNFGNDPKIVKFFATGYIHDFMYFLQQSVLIITETECVYCAVRTESFNVI